MFNEQSKVQGIKKPLNWLMKKEPPKRMYGSYDLQKYHKHLGRLFLDGNIVCRQFFGHSGRNFVKQVVIPKQLQTELMYRFHNSKLKGNLGTTNTIQRIRKKFYFAGHTEILIIYINSSLTCLQTKPPKVWRYPPSIQTQAYPQRCYKLEEIVGQLQNSGGYSCILTGTGVF